MLESLGARVMSRLPCNRLQAVDRTKAHIVKTEKAAEQMISIALGMGVLSRKRS